MTTVTNERASEIKVEIVEDAADIVNQASSQGSLNKHEFSLSVKEHSKSKDSNELLRLNIDSYSNRSA